MKTVAARPSLLRQVEVPESTSRASIASFPKAAGQHDSTSASTSSFLSSVWGRRNLHSLSKLSARCCAGRHKKALFLIFFACIVVVVIVLISAMMQGLLGLSGASPVVLDRAAVPPVRPWNESLAVVVAHRTALACLDVPQVQQRDLGNAATMMRRTQLPSWTLHVVERECVECLDKGTHAAAVRRHDEGLATNAEIPEEASAVFAAVTAPLGLVGPMLYAMASATDGVSAAAELPKWGWLQHGHPTHAGKTSPYLVVMGIPTTDQPARASLRDAQRATWLSYRDVARSANEFRGALLPLYVFAAAERVMPRGVTDVSPLLPTVAEYEAASHVRAGGGAAVGGYTQRRVVLALDFGSIAADDARLADSPCVKIVQTDVRTPKDAGSGVEEPVVVQLSTALALPITPAFVAPAEFVCRASTALWQEALAHRNVLWVDMMTDRKPTTNKRIGGSGNWGLPVEVGMTQKLILWLEYAYHQFPDVPYIMKSDDDTYMKVPQFIADMRFIRAGYRGERSHMVSEVRDPPGIKDTEECIYWGSYRLVERQGLPTYHAGAGYLLHRRLVQVMIEMSNATNALTVKLASTPFDPIHTKTYTKMTMNIEDVFVGIVLRDKRRRIHEVCPFHYAVLVGEVRPRHFDLHRRRSPAVSGPTVILHHCTAADEYYLHYFFQHEREVGDAHYDHDEMVDRRETAKARDWVASQIPSTTIGFGNYHKLLWTQPKGKVVASYVSVGDNVSVYSMPYGPVRQRTLDHAKRSFFP